MQLLVIVLNRIEYLDKLLTRFGDEKIPGATILDSKGMAMELGEHDELRFLGSLRSMLDPAHHESKTIFMVIQEERIPLVSKIVREVTGGLDKPDTGIMFSVPVNYMEGLTFKQ
ncbi:MAG: hypothetical protein II359_01980 [Clostridia bacterium]|nr:hypothetical protein [Clostridia bacterium]